MRALVEALCSEDCAGRAPGSPGGLRARELVRDALRDAGLDPHEQPLAMGGANVLAALPGRDVDRWILLAAHYDHLGRNRDGAFYAGADDNAAAVAILVETARRLVEDRPDGRGVLFCAFDAEEPPYFLSSSMGSEHWLRAPTVPLETVDLMVCMDLVGHHLGPERVPDEVRRTVLCLGAERSAGTSPLVDEIAETEENLTVRRVDAQIIPPLSDYHGFWERRRPFLFLTNGRNERYHTPEDTPEHLAWGKMEATARWLEALTRQQCARPEAPFVFQPGRDDLSTVEALLGVLRPLAPLNEMAAFGLHLAEDLRGQIRRDRTLPERAYATLRGLLAQVEDGLAG